MKSKLKQLQNDLKKDLVLKIDAQKKLKGGGDDFIIRDDIDGT